MALEALSLVFDRLSHSGHTFAGNDLHDKAFIRLVLSTNARLSVCCYPGRSGSWQFRMPVW